ncbi:MAG: MerR family transcriptional regulator [Candidatus Geothermincolia bacterium]
MPQGLPQDLFSISELAAEFGITPRAIRYYEEVGLILPLRSSPTAQRNYDRRARARLKLILRGKRFGFSLSEIKEMIELYDADPTEREQLRRTIALGARRIAEIDEMIGELEELKAEMLEFARRFQEKLEKEGA